MYIWLSKSVEVLYAAIIIWGSGIGYDSNSLKYMGLMNEFSIAISLGEHFPL